MVRTLNRLNRIIYVLVNFPIVCCRYFSTSPMSDSKSSGRSLLRDAAVPWDPLMAHFPNMGPEQQGWYLILSIKKFKNKHFSWKLMLCSVKVLLCGGQRRGPQQELRLRQGGWEEASWWSWTTVIKVLLSYSSYRYYTGTRTVHTAYTSTTYEYLWRIF